MPNSSLLLVDAQLGDFYKTYVLKHRDEEGKIHVVGVFSLEDNLDGRKEESKGASLD